MMDKIKKEELRVALVILFDCDGRILLQHRTEDAARLPGHWAFFGGSIGEGESPKEAVCREAVEELNYKLVDPSLILEQDFELSNAQGRLYIFIDEFLSDKALLKLGEGQGWGWFYLSEIYKLKMIDQDRKIIEQAMLVINARRNA